MHGSDEGRDIKPKGVYPTPLPRHSLPSPLLSLPPMANNSRSAAALLALLFVALVVGPASASTLTAFSGPGCAGQSKFVRGCGCFNLAGYKGGFDFTFSEGLTASFYSSANCHGRSGLTLTSQSRYCRSHPFSSIRIDC